MAGHSRYHVSERSAGLENGVLKNKLKVDKQEELDKLETILLTDTYHFFLELLKKGEIKFDLSLLFSIHKYFLGTLYDWAGKIRTVNISKDGVTFAQVRFIDESLKDLEILISKELPKESDNKDEVAEKLALIHNELNAIHPFREGNGRTIRLFLDLIAISIGYDRIHWDNSPRKEYFGACKDGMATKNSSMEVIIEKGLKRISD